MKQSIVRSRGGREERTLLLSDVVIPVVPAMSTEDIAQLWINCATKLKSDLLHALADLRDGNPSSCDLFVPSYWKAAIKLPADQAEPMLEPWQLAHDLGKAVFEIQHQAWPVEQNGVPGMPHHCLKKR